MSLSLFPAVFSQSQISLHSSKEERAKDNLILINKKTDENKAASRRVYCGLLGDLLLEEKKDFQGGESSDIFTIGHLQTSFQLPRRLD